ncbi:hypothetical protein J6590_001506 [Homalodisca vitripennis]|nr:hypothetical protein J6590_001506 [Homalodisca vitripennis]
MWSAGNCGMHGVNRFVCGQLVCLWRCDVHVVSPCVCGCCMWSAGVSVALRRACGQPVCLWLLHVVSRCNCGMHGDSRCVCGVHVASRCVCGVVACMWSAILLSTPWPIDYWTYLGDGSWTRQLSGFPVIVGDKRLAFRSPSSTSVVIVIAWHRALLWRSSRQEPEVYGEVPIVCGDSDSLAPCSSVVLYPAEAWIVR